MEGWTVRKSCVHFVFLGIVFLHMIFAVYLGSEKEGYYIDELWSYGLANSYKMPHLQEMEGYMGNWHEPDFYEQYLVVGPEETFAWESVYSNQEKDVHPPLFYFLLHSICSLFPGEFSKWYGLVINYAFFIGILFLLYLLSGTLFGKANFTRLLTVIIYGISAGALSGVMYIRMYMMLVFFTLLFAVLVRYAMTTEGKNHKWNLAGLTLTCMAGGMTQYYFLIFAFFISVCYVFWRLLRKEWRKAFFYSLSVWLGLGLDILVFPALLQHILVGEKGQESFANTVGGFSVFWMRLQNYIRIVADAFFMGKVVWLIAAGLIAFCCAVIFLLSKQWRNDPDGKTAVIYICFLAISVSAYFLLIVQISTDIVDRYQFLIYPFIVLIILYPIIEVCRLFHKGFLVWIMLAGYIFCCFLSYGNGTGKIAYLYPGYQDALQLLEISYDNAPGVYVTKGDHLVINNCLFLSKQKMTYALSIEELTKLPAALKSLKMQDSDVSEDELVLYVDIYYQEDETAQKVCELLGYHQTEHLYDNMFTQIYILKK